MRSITRFGCSAAATAVAAVTMTGLAATADAQAVTGRGHHTQHAVFVQTDEVGGNHVATYAEANDGTLTFAHSYATGGKGGILPTSVVDHTASQNSVVYDSAHELLFVANAGSNTVSVFKVKGTALTLLQIVGSGGTFPMSIAVHDRQVFVLNAQNGGALQGYFLLGDHLVPVSAWHRPLGLDPTLTTFTQTPGQVSFSPNGQQVLVTTKANTNSIDVFNLDRFGAPSLQAVHNVRAGAVPFALTFDQRGNVVVVDAGTASVTTLSLSPTGTLSTLSSVATGQRGTCWVVRDGHWLFTTNPGAPSVTSLSLNYTSAPAVLGSFTTDPGTVDPAVSQDGRYLYVETGANGIVDEFSVNNDGSLTTIGSVVVADAAGAEGIATS